jgi:hypothetical protein
MQGWNDFVASYPKAHLFAALVSVRLPKGLAFDVNGKKLPTPYRLLNEWLARNLKGPHSSTSTSLGVVIGVVEEADRKFLTERFGPCRGGGPRVGNRSVPILRNYMDGSYAQLAHELGYQLNFGSTKNDA